MGGGGGALSLSVHLLTVVPLPLFTLTFVLRLTILPTLQINRATEPEKKSTSTFRPTFLSIVKKLYLLDKKTSPLSINFSPLGLRNQFFRRHLLTLSATSILISEWL